MAKIRFYKTDSFPSSGPDGLYFLKEDEEFSLMVRSDNELYTMREDDPTVPAHVKGITVGDIGEWDESYAMRHSHTNKAIIDAIEQPFTTSLKNKLAGIAAGANNYVHPTGDGNLHVPATGTGNAGKFLKAGAIAASIMWASIVKADIGDWAHTHPISEVTGLQTTLDGKIGLSSPLTGYAVGANTAIAATDTILQAFGKTQGQINALNLAAGNYVLKAGDTMTGSLNFTSISLIRKDGISVISAPTVSEFIIQRHNSETATTGRIYIRPINGSSEGQFDIRTTGDTFYYGRMFSVGYPQTTETVSLHIGRQHAGRNGSSFLYFNSGPTTAGRTTIQRAAGDNGGFFINHEGVGSFRIRVVNEANIDLFTADSRRATILANGNFLVSSSTSDNGYKLQINAGGAANNGFYVNGKMATNSIAVGAMVKVGTGGVLEAGVAGTDFVAPSGLGSYTPTARTLTINGTSGRVAVTGGTQDLTANRTWAVDLAASGVSAGTYTKVTVDTYGRVTAGASLLEADIPALTISKITGLQGALDDKEPGFSKGNIVQGTGVVLSGTLTSRLVGAGNLTVGFDTTFGDGRYALKAEIPTIPTNYVTTNTDQLTALTGHKSWEGQHVFSGYPIAFINGTYNDPDGSAGGTFMPLNGISYFNINTPINAPVIPGVSTTYQWTTFIVQAATSRQFQIATSHSAGYFAYRALHTTGSNAWHVAASQNRHNAFVPNSTTSLPITAGAFRITKNATGTYVALDSDAAEQVAIIRSWSNVGEQMTLLAGSLRIDSISGTGNAFATLSSTGLIGRATMGTTNQFWTGAGTLENISALSGSYVTTNTSQTSPNLSGNKTWSGTHTFSKVDANNVTIERTGSNSNTYIRYSNDSGIIYAGIGAQNTFAIGGTANLSGGTNTWLNVSQSLTDIFIGGFRVTSLAGAGTRIATISSSGDLGVTATIGNAYISDIAYTKVTGAPWITGNQTITLTGNITGSGTTSIATTIANSAVTYAKIQNVTSARILGRYSAGAGVVQEISLGAGLTLNAGTGVLDVAATSGNYIQNQIDAAQTGNFWITGEGRMRGSLMLGYQKPSNADVYINFQASVGAADNYDFRIFREYSSGAVLLDNKGAGSMQLVTRGAGDIILFTNNTNRFSISGVSGNVNIGQSSATTYKLSVYSASDTGDGLHVRGDGFFTGDVTFFSDRRKKSNWVRMASALNRINHINGYEYTFNGRRDYGVFTDEVVKVLPYAIGKSPDGYDTLSYRTLHALEIEAIKELDEKKADNEEIARLEERVKFLENKLGYASTNS